MAKYLQTVWPHGVLLEQPLLTSCGRRLYCDIVLLDRKGSWCAVVEVDGKDHRGKGPSYKIHRLRDRLKDRTVRRRRWSMLRVPQDEWDEVTRRRHLDAFVTKVMKR